MNKEQLAQMIDQTLLTQTATYEQTEAFCKEARTYGFASVCINPVYIPLAAKVLAGSATKVCTVIDFPLGAGGTELKKTDAVNAVKAGADEVDLVVDLGLVKDHNWAELEDQFTEVTKALREQEKLLGKKIIEKVILETCYLTDEEITEASLCMKRAGCDFVKTSTGFAIVKGSDGKLMPNGATVHAVELMRKAVGPEMGVKASGGIHSYEEAIALINAGATRIGASAGVKILEGCN